jgi:cytochrome b pre-mRNA-processing protein 3
MIGRLFKLPFASKRAINARVIDRLHGDIMAAARHPALYLELGVPDSFEGRFEAFALLAILTIRRLAAMAPPGPDMAQDLTDAIFRHFDVMLREIGVGDLSVPKRVRALARAFMGRSHAYHGALQDDAAMASALSRNVGSGEGDPGALLDYVRACTNMLEATSLGTFSTGPLRFPEPAASLPRKE